VSIVIYLPASRWNSYCSRLAFLPYQGVLSRSRIRLLYRHIIDRPDPSSFASLRAWQLQDFQWVVRMSGTSIMWGAFVWAQFDKSSVFQSILNQSVRKPACGL
jgi:hypothetical protein